MDGGQGGSAHSTRPPPVLMIKSTQDRSAPEESEALTIPQEGSLQTSTPSVVFLYPVRGLAHSPTLTQLPMWVSVSGCSETFPTVPTWSQSVLHWRVNGSTDRCF